MTAIELRPEGTPRSARLFEAHAPRLLAYCVRRLGSRPEAEDAVQTVFLYVHRALDRGVVPKSDEAWLLAIAKNVCRWQQRTASRRAPTVGELDPDTLASRRDESDVEEIHRDLEDALTAVPERQRQALLLREWRGLSCPEIAEVLELSPPATHALLTRARRSVAHALSAAGRRPVLGLDLASLVAQLRAVVAGSAAKTAATAVAVAGLGVGGVAVERAIDPGDTASRPASQSSGGSLSPRATPSDWIVASQVRHTRTRGPLMFRGDIASGPEVTQPRAGAVNAQRWDSEPVASDPLPPQVDQLPRDEPATNPKTASTQPAVPVKVPPPPSVDPGAILDVPIIRVPPLPDPSVPAVQVPAVQAPSVPAAGPVTGLLP